jgi:hypothetical protein
MKKPAIFLAAAAVSYIAMIAFVRLHLIGRDADMINFKTNPITAVVASLYMLAVSASYLYATKEQDGGKTIRIGCLGVFIAFTASLIGTFVDITPDSWAPVQSQLFTKNLITVTTVPFIIVCVLGVRRLRVAEASQNRKSHW